MQNRKNLFPSSHTAQDEHVFPRDLPAVSVPFPHGPGLLSEASAIPGRAGSPGAGSTAPAGRHRRPFHTSGGPGAAGLLGRRARTPPCPSSGISPSAQPQARHPRPVRRS